METRPATNVENQIILERLSEGYRADDIEVMDGIPRNITWSVIEKIREQREAKSSTPARRKPKMKEQPKIDDTDWRGEVHIRRSKIMPPSGSASLAGAMKRKRKSQGRYARSFSNHPG